MNAARTAESGVGLVEVMVALSILSIVLIALGGLMFQVGRQTRESAGDTYRAAAVQQSVSHFEAVPYEDLAGQVGCVARTVGELNYDRCVTVADDGLRRKLVTIVISSTGVFAAAPETVTVRRSEPRQLSPLRNTP